MATSNFTTLEVTCPCGPESTFEKRVKIEPGTENSESKVLAFCPFCGKYVKLDIVGKQGAISIQRTTRKA